jgi:sugar phosphate isomerase/epimerase
LGSPAGSQALDALFEGGPSLEWQADVGWIARAGADPVAAVEARRDRLTSVHLKDLALRGTRAKPAGPTWARARCPGPRSPAPRRARDLDRRARRTGRRHPLRRRLDRRPAVPAHLLAPTPH